MSGFDNVVRRMQEDMQAKEQRYREVRDQRAKELQALADECDVMLDGRRNRKRKKELGLI